MQTISQVLTQTAGDLHGLLSHYQKLQRLSQKVKSFLPDYLSQYCHVAAWEENHVTLHVNHASAGTVLRYQLRSLLPLLQNEPRYKKITHIACHVRPAIPVAAPTKYKRPPNAHAARVLHTTAAHISTKELQVALKKLAKTLASL